MYIVQYATAGSVCLNHESWGLKIHADGSLHFYLCAFLKCFIAAVLEFLCVFSGFFVLFSAAVILNVMNFIYLLKTASVTLQRGNGFK